MFLNETLLSNFNLTNYREQMIESILNNLKKYNDENIKLNNISQHLSNLKIANRKNMLDRNE